MAKNDPKVKKTTLAKRLSTWKGWAGSMTWALILIFTAAFPLLLTPDKYVGLTEGKYGYFLFITIAYLVLLLFRRTTAAMIGEEKLSLPAKKTFAGISFAQYAMMAYLLVAIVSAVCSEHSDSVWKGAGRFDGLLTLLLYGVLFFCASAYGKLDKWHIGAIGISMTLFSVIGILQLWGIDVLNLYPEGMYYAGTYFVTTIGNIDVVATMLCITLPLMCVAVVTGEDKRRWLLLIPIGLCLFFEVMINVDAGTMGLLVTAAIMAPILLRDRRQIMNGMLLLSVLFAAMFLAHSINISYTLPATDGEALALSTSVAFGMFEKLLVCAAGACALIWAALRFALKKEFKLKPAVFTAVLALLVVAAVAGGLTYAYNNCDEDENGGQGLVYVIGQVMHGNFDDSFGSYRLLVWKRALPMAMENPVIGTGPDTFAIEFTQRYQADVEAAGLNVTYDFAHNDFIQTLCNLGILGLLAYVLVLAGVAIGFFRYACRDKWTAMLGASVLCYCVQSFFAFTIIIAAPAFYIILGLLDGRNRENRALRMQSAKLKPNR